MSFYKINSRQELKGKIKANGNKNAALPCLVATLLTDEAVILNNMPDIADVKVLLEIMKSIGTSVERLGPKSYRLQTKNIRDEAFDKEKCSRIRASILLLAPLLSRVGKVSLPPPGGDIIGRRRIDAHILALESLGAIFTFNDCIEFIAPANGLQGNEIFLDEASVTATENAIMASVLAKGKTSISNAACEPHVQDLCKMLVQMGAKIEGIGSNILIIESVSKLQGTEFSISFDFMETVSYLALGAVTNGEIEITGINPNHLRMSQLVYKRLGIEWEYSGDSVLITPGQNKKVQSDIGNLMPTISDAPWPGFPPDVASITIVAATQCQGTVLVHEKMFESRMFFVDRLITMGANIVLCDPHRAVVSGASELKGAHLSSPDVRAGMALVMAALCAKGKSVIENIYQVERGYANLIENLQSLGADIERQ